MENLEQPKCRIAERILRRRILPPVFKKKFKLTLGYWLDPVARLNYTFMK